MQNGFPDPPIGINMITLFMGPMQILPTPTGNPITSPAQFTTVWTGNFQTDLNNVLKAMRAKGDTQLATQFRQWALQEHAKDPNIPVSRLLPEFIGIEAAGGIGTAIGQTGTLLGQIPGAAAKGAESLGGFNLGGWFLRIGEILLGLVLVGVGVARITGTQNAISKIVKTKVPL